jgi:predicted nucleotidyltransferase
MHYAVPLIKLFGSKSTLQVLDYFLDNPTKNIHAAALIRVLRLSRKSVFDALKHLEKSGLILRVAIGRMVLYSLNRPAPVVKHLKIIRTIEWITPQLEHLNGLVGVFLYGSAARGEDVEDSDIDLLVISSGEDPKQLIGKLHIEKLGNKLKPYIITSLEYARLAREDRAFYERVEADKIRLV